MDGEPWMDGEPCTEKLSVDKESSLEGALHNVSSVHGAGDSRFTSGYYSTSDASHTAIALGREHN
eukprot:2918424-Pyramimonas_sp.AAC.1